MRLISLDQIDIAEPCPASWNKMRGNSKVRFCSHCQKTVFDLSAMPTLEAERLVCESGGELCIRFSRTADGAIKTLDYQSQAGRGWSWRVWMWASIGVALVAGMVEAAIYGDRSSLTGRTMGAMVRPGTWPTSCPSAATTPADDDSSESPAQ